MKVGSLFSGIGGFDLGLERAGGFQTAWFCEQDPYCTKVLNKHWPDVPVYPDITELKGSDVEPVDVLCGGFPCQDLSVAGKGAGLAGARSGLWSEYARLIGELRPSYVVVENVSALLARGMGTVLGDLAALGYDAEWDCIPASAVGAPHQRDRVWLVAYPGSESGGLAERRGGGQERQSADAPQSAVVRQGDGSGCAEGFAACGGEGDGRQAHTGGERVVADPGGERGTVGREARHLAGTSRGSQENGAERERNGYAVDDRGADVADTDAACSRGVSGWPTGEWWAVEPAVGRVAYGVPARVDRLRSLGNALVPQIAEWLGHRILAYEAANALEQAA